MPAPVNATQFFANVGGVSVQLHESDGDCYESSFTATQAVRNDGKLFSAQK